MNKRRLDSVMKPVVCLVVLGLVACAATTLTDSWRDPGYKGPPLQKILVVGVSSQPDLRRNFEDTFVSQLKAVGVDAAPSYRFIPESGPAEQTKLKQAVKEAGSDGVLITRLVRVDVNTQVIPAYAGAGMGFYPGYAGAWSGFYDPPMVYQTNTIVLQTSLYGVNESQLLWSGTTHTFAPTDVKKDILDFAQLIVGTLQKQKLV